MTKKITHISPLVIRQTIVPRRGRSMTRRGSVARDLALQYRARVTKGVTDIFGAGLDESAKHHMIPEGKLNGEILWSIYKNVGDIRAPIDSIARRVSTWDNTTVVKKTVPPDGELYSKALGQAAAVDKFFETPNKEGDTLQTLLSAWTVDALVFWHGVLEKVYSRGKDLISVSDGQALTRRRGEIEQLVTVYSPTIFPVESETNGRISHWVQDGIEAGRHWASSRDDYKPKKLETSQIVRIQISPSSRSPFSAPLIETICEQVTLLVRGTERAVRETDMGQIMPGLLVITGASSKVLDDIKLSAEQGAGNPHVLQAIHTPGATSPVHWLQLKRDFQEIQYLPLSKDARRVIWRVMGVSNIEMNDVEGSNRSTAAAELDVSGSALIEPLLEMIEQVMNRDVIPDIVRKHEGNPDAKVLVKWEFDRSVKHTAQEDLDQSGADKIRLETGQRSINELRRRDGFPRIEGGDVYRIGEAVIGEDPGEETGVVDEDVEAIEDGEEEDDRADGPDMTHGYDLSALLALGARSSHSDDLPSEWQSPGMFDGLRTIDLRALWEEVVDYRRSVAREWEEMRRAVVELTEAAVITGTLGNSVYLTQLSALIGELKAAWETVTRRRYERTMDIGLRAAQKYAPTQVGGQANTITDTYANNAMTFLDDLLSDVQTRVQANVSAVTARAKLTADAGLGPDSDPEDLIRSVENAIDANEHRIDNWSGRLVELASAVFVSALLEGPPVPPSTDDTPEPGTVDPEAGATPSALAAQWWVSWEYVGDSRVCETCEREGTLPIRPLSTLTVLPGGDTQCRARCRCVLVVYTPQEVASGEAQKINRSRNRE